jgi:serine/threonine-protein kinase
MGDPSSKGGEAGSGDDPSVTSVAGPSLIRERTPDIERGMVLAGRYQIEAVIGRGGSGIVLRAFDRTAQTVVAVKVLKPELVHDERWSKRFSRELRLGRPIRDPNVCRIFDIGEGDGHRFLTMELATGGTLRDLIKRGEPLRPLDERLKDAAAAIGGLAAIHEAGIVHRDVKPDNMLRMEDGRLAISDFGLATDLPAAAAVTVMVGTPHYMAPEVRAGEPATTRSDVWALGVVLYEIFFGKRPERRSSMSSAGMSKPPAPLTSSAIERAMLSLCERCLAEDPIARPSSARVVLEMFRRASTSPQRFLLRRWRAMTVAAALFIAGGSWLALRELRPVRAVSPATGRTGSPAIVPTGSATDWGVGASLIARASGRVHCFAVLDPDTVRIVWGEPRRAEDIEVSSGARHPSELRPEVYAVGCPELSPHHDALLFSALNTAGATEVRLAASRDGSRWTSVTPGSEPAWLANGEEFIYSVDASHAAIFSLSTMQFALLPEAPHSDLHGVAMKATSQIADRAAVVFRDSDADTTIAVYEGKPMTARAAFGLSGAVAVRFDPDNDDLLVFFEPGNEGSRVARVDWRRGTATELGFVRDKDLTGVEFPRAGVVVLARTESSDAWLYDGPQRRRLTSDGQVFSASRSLTGDLLLGKRGKDGNYSVWWQPADGPSKQVTKGGRDVMPQFSSDGGAWTYVDYARRTIMLCKTGGSCSPVTRDDLLPGWPRLSPDGRNIAYLTQLDTPRLAVAPVDGGATRMLSAAQLGCPPTWSSNSRVWVYEGVRGHRAWVERDINTGEKTGQTFAARGNSHETGEPTCWSVETGPDRPSLGKVRVEKDETSELLLLPQSRYARGPVSTSSRPGTAPGP